MSLEKIYFHPDISSQELKRIIEAHKSISFKKDEFLLREGNTADAYYIIETGLCRSFIINDQGREISTNFFTEAEIMIEVLSLFKQIPTLENLQALTKGTAWKIPFSEFQILFHSVPAFMEWGRGWMSNELFNEKQRAVEMISKSAMARYKKLLLDKPEVIKYAPLKYVASFLGITDTSLSRIRKELAIGQG